MLEVLVRNRRWLLIRGYAVVVFGTLAVILPGLTWTVLMLLYGTYAIVDGVAALMLLRGGAHARRGEIGALMVVGLFGIGAGGTTFLWAGYSSLLVQPTAIPPLTVIAAWAITRGVLEIVASVRLRREFNGEWMLGLAGVLSIGFGVVLVLQAATGLLGLVWFVGIYAIVAGVLYIALGARLGKLDKGFRHASRAT